MTSLRLLALPLAVASLFLGACATPSDSTYYTGQRFTRDHPALVARNAQIAAEPRGDFYIGRRYFIDGTRFWGFIRKPGQPWQQAKLSVINEDQKFTPDRQRQIDGSAKMGFDHNHEYRLYGRFTGERVYDPNSNQVLPEFLLTRYELISSNPGFLFHPEQTFRPQTVPKPPRLQ